MIMPITSNSISFTFLFFHLLSIHPSLLNKCNQNLINYRYGNDRVVERTRWRADFDWGVWTNTQGTSKSGSNTWNNLPFVIDVVENFRDSFICIDTRQNGLHRASFASSRAPPPQVNFVHIKYFVSLHLLLVVIENRLLIQITMIHTSDSSNFFLWVVRWRHFGHRVKKNQRTKNKTQTYQKSSLLQFIKQWNLISISLVYVLSSGYEWFFSFSFTLEFMQYSFSVLSRARYVFSAFPWIDTCLVISLLLL